MSDHSCRLQRDAQKKKKTRKKTKKITKKKKKKGKKEKKQPHRLSMEATTKVVESSKLSPPPAAEQGRAHALSTGIADVKEEQGGGGSRDSARLEVAAGRDCGAAAEPATKREGALSVSEETSQQHSQRGSGSSRADGLVGEAGGGGAAAAAAAANADLPATTTGQNRKSRRNTRKKKQKKKKQKKGAKEVPPPPPQMRLAAAPGAGVGAEFSDAVDALFRKLVRAPNGTQYNGL